MGLAVRCRRWKHAGMPAGVREKSSFFARAAGRSIPEDEPRRNRVAARDPRILDMERQFDE